MSTCPECKQPTREGAAFCQSCGARIGGTAEPQLRPGDGAARLPDAAGAKSVRPPLVGAAGKTLIAGAAPARPAAKSAPVAAQAESSAHVVCPDCNTPNPIGMNFCKMCGAPHRAG